MTSGCRGEREGGNTANYFYLGLSCVHGKPCVLLRLLVNDLDVSLVTILIQF